MSNLSALDMALDDVITQNRSGNKRGGNNNGRRGPVRGGGINKNRSGRSSSSPYNGRPGRQNSNQNSNSNSNNSNNNNNSRGSPNKPRSSNNSLVVANLHFNVTEKDLYDLFGQFGQVKRAFLHIGPNGKSAGIADVVFGTSNDAERAKVTYNNVELDGRPMRITSASIIQSTAVSNSNGPRRNNNSNSNGNGNGNRRFGGNNSNNNNNNNNSNSNNRRRNARPQPNEKDLDADMDSYMANNEDIQMN